ncbi:MAG: hypothetical protein ACR2IA_06500 [Pyrinomonadaceae bacterium]
MDIKINFSTDIAKRILGNTEQATMFLLEMQRAKKLDLPTRTITRGINKDKEILNLETNEIWAKIVEHWDFETGEKMIRELFKTTDKYKSGKDSYATMNVLLEEWKKINFGDVAWSFPQGDFDAFVQRVNAEKVSGFEKDEKVKIAAVKYRRIKEINTVRNDFIETLIFEKNENILPTLNHRKNVDFFINGISFDQKVAKSPTGEFKGDFGEDWKNYAIAHPEKVAEYLYRFQKEERFGADSRLLVVYLDEDVSIERIAEVIQETNLEEPLEITFEYNHRNQEVKTYWVICFVVLLYN